MRSSQGSRSPCLQLAADGFRTGPWSEDPVALRLSARTRKTVNAAVKTEVVS
jgi:hypothetical protein